MRLPQAELEISNSAALHNFKYFKSLLKPDTKILVLVKSNSYGHGGVEFARMILDAGADYLGIATLQEGVKLRRAGISSEVRLEIKRAYHILFCSGLKRVDAIEQARQAVHSAEALKLVEFVQTATRPICMPRISRRANLGGEQTSE